MKSDENESDEQTDVSELSVFSVGSDIVSS